jgi:hypothetical protein
MTLPSREESAASGRPSESPQAERGRGLSLVRDMPTRDDPRYWHQRPADHGEDGLYEHGPREARPSLSLVPDVGPGAVGDADAEGRPRPHACRATPRAAVPHGAPRHGAGRTPRRDQGRVTTADKLLALANLSAARERRCAREMDRHLTLTREPDAPSMLDTLRFAEPFGPSSRS